MTERELERLLAGVAEGRISAAEATRQIRLAPFEDLGFAKLDHHRGIRQGAAEVIYGAGKTPEQIAAIAARLRAHEDGPVLITRMDASKAERLRGIWETEAPELAGALHYHETAGIGIVGDMPSPDGRGYIVIATGGTSDMPVAEEAALTAEFLGNETHRLYDVGVAGLQRLLAHTEEIMQASAIVAIAGMEGALASVIGGLADCPVLAVPTSVGYGASFGGIAALLSMLNSCASGVSVVNIDNGFGAAYQASMINHLKDGGTA
ncbi:nickel pincer cofactor biosynthesis protein LarB [Lachnoclostridium sp. Marseille-P6806]|uniref:nickel pincer cofactor biosynthesis protein LarB n=1 Tax=Lachnoclostridium sp. Marseille-P6806 TaxID=2364793 RepID=UPI00102F31ED|nr:nickel pincer cofactor biosynthesis protein LarB [Lachnoclostridium sp. Marseille-P6806]